MACSILEFCTGGQHGIAWEAPIDLTRDVAFHYRDRLFNRTMFGFRTHGRTAEMVTPTIDGSLT
jgi:hypothetical protein